MATKRSRTQTTYGLIQPLANAPDYIYAKRAPTSADQANVGAIWIDEVGNKAYFLTSVVAGVANWAVAGTTSGSGTFSSLTVNGASTLNGALTVASGTGAINISNDAAATAIAIGTGAGDKTVTVGSTNTTSTTTVQSGSGGILLEANGGATPITLGSVVEFGAAGIQILTGAGAPTASVPKGSLYLRTDGSGTNDRAYIATDAVGTWTAIVTVA